MCRLWTLTIFILSFFCIAAAAQEPYGKRIKVVFYNVENLFDTYNDSLKEDDEFTPGGSKYWNYQKYQSKLTNIYKTLIAVSGWEPAGIVGLCEIENLRTLEDLVYKTPLKKFNYQIIHKESPDPRGIDVALIYRRDLFVPIAYETAVVRGRKPHEWFSREILYVKGLLFGSDTIHLFVNHWPSRSGGQSETENRRLYAATLLKHKTDSLFRYENNPRILIMGDLNDNPDDRSLRLLAGDSSMLINLMDPLYRKGKGSAAYSSDKFFQWHLFDQFIVSDALMNDPLKIGEANIFRPPWLCDPNTGAPFRTYRGPLYLGGFSDHFPIHMDIYRK